MRKELRKRADRIYREKRRRPQGMQPLGMETGRMERTPIPNAAGEIWRQTLTTIWLTTSVPTQKTARVR
jgi:hypothetical protein